MTLVGKKRMKCKFENDYNIFADYITGKLDTFERSELEAHLFECEQCRLKAGAVEKIGRVIQADEYQPVDLPLAVTVSDKVKVFFDSLVTIKYPKLATIPLFIVLLFAAASLPFYYSAIDNVYDLKVENDAFSGMRSIRNASELSVQEKLFNLQFSEGINAFVNNEYEKALAIFSSLETLLKDSTVADTTKRMQVFKFEYSMGVTKAALWQNSPSGYFTWITSTAQGQPLETTRLTEAQAHLAKALELSREISTTLWQHREEDQQQREEKQHNILLDEEIVDTLIKSIRGKINS